MDSTLAQKSWKWHLVLSVFVLQLCIQAQVTYIIFFMSRLSHSLALLASFTVPFHWIWSNKISINLFKHDKTLNNFISFIVRRSIFMLFGCFVVFVIIAHRHGQCITVAWYSVFGSNCWNKITCYRLAAFENNNNRMCSSIMYR